jgi:hypothetical protein
MRLSGFARSLEPAQALSDGERQTVNGLHGQQAQLKENVGVL